MKIQEALMKLDVFSYSANCERLFELTMEDCGHKRETTFFSDLSIAEWVQKHGMQKDAVMDTHKNVMKNWMSDIKYITEYCISLNHKIFQWFDYDNDLARLYDKLWRDCDLQIMSHYKDNEEAMDYYFHMTD